MWKPGPSFSLIPSSLLSACVANSGYHLSICPPEKVSYSSRAIFHLPLVFSPFPFAKLLVEVVLHCHLAFSKIHNRTEVQRAESPQLLFKCGLSWGWILSVFTILYFYRTIFLIFSCGYVFFSFCADISSMWTRFFIFAWSEGCQLIFHYISTSCSVKNALRMSSAEFRFCCCFVNMADD